MATGKSPVVLITGANGFIGYKTVVEALRAGYHVRAAVRRQDAVDAIAAGPSVQAYLGGDQLSFRIIPDMTLPDAFIDAAHGCAYIIHVAAALASRPGRLVAPAVHSVKAVLAAAEATPTMRRVVFTAAGCSVVPFARFLPDHPANMAVVEGNADDVPSITSASEVADIPLLPDDAPRFHEYAASKVATMNVVRDYARARHPQAAHFSLVNLMPGFVLGPEELVRTKTDALQGSNMILSWLFHDLKLNPMFGVDENTEMGLIAGIVHLDDTVEGHIKALDTATVPGTYRAFFMCAEPPHGPRVETAVDVIKEQLPEEAKRIPFAGRLSTVPFKFDASDTEKELLGHPFIPYSKMVVDTIKWYMSLPD